MDDYTKAYISLIERAQQHRALPWFLKCRIGARLGRNGSFLLLHREQVICAMQDCLGSDAESAGRQFRLLCESTGVAVQMIWQLANISERWLERYIQTEDGRCLQEAVETGAVIISHHSFHHNLLASYFKLYGLVTYPVANPPAAFSADDYLYNFTLRLNRDTESNLNGGHFLYNNQRKDFVQDLRHALGPGRVLLLFCDFNEVKNTNPVLPFLGKTLQIPTGVLRLVEKEALPVYFAGFRREPPGSYRLSLSRLKTQSTDPKAASLGEQYLAALEKHVRQYPAAWQCWESLCCR